MNFNEFDIDSIDAFKWKHRKFIEFIETTAIKSTVRFNKIFPLDRSTIRATIHQNELSASWKANFFSRLFFCAIGKSHKTWAPNSYVQHTLISVQIRKFDLRKLLFSVTNFLCLQNTLLIFYRYALNLKSDAKKFNVFSLCFVWDFKRFYVFVKTIIM